MKSRIVAHNKMAVKTAKFCRIPKLWEHLSTVTMEVTADLNTNLFTRRGVKKYTLKSSSAKAIKMRLHRL